LMKAIGILCLSVALLGAYATAHAQQAAPEITLPEIMAVELPRGVAEIGPTAPPLHELLAAARSGTRLVTSDLQRKVGPGPVRVTWTAWDGPVGIGKPAATRVARVFVLPAGMTPVGVSGDENATGGNNAARIADDSAGRVHMVWVDSGRPGGRTGPVYRRVAIGADGAIRFETAPTYIAEGGPGDWDSYPALAVAGDSVHLVWQGAGTVRTRRLLFSPAGWVFGPIRDTGAKSEGRDVGPAVAVDAKGGVHIVTPSGVYGFSSDGGQSWKTEAVPMPPNLHIKTASLALDLAGTVHVAFSAIVTRPDPPTGKLGGYWQLRTIRRAANGNWSDATDVLTGVPGWSEPKGADDVLADWVRIAADKQGGLHLTWHGTVNSRKYANDAAFYAWRKPGAAWQMPVQLVPQDPARGIKFSFAPSLALDGERALPLVFYDVYSGPNWIGFDTALATLRNGRMERSLLPVTQFVLAAIEAKQPEIALSSRFPASAPEVWHGPDGRMRLDVLELLKSGFEPVGANLIVYHRLDLTSSLRNP
jgi:hypothetical protein